MSNEDPSTDYGLSSEIDIIFSEMKEDKKPKNPSEISQATSLQFASQAKDDKISIKETTNEDKSATDHGSNADDKLITWAARLELESISLKEMVTGNLGHIFKQNYDFLKIACEEMTTKLSQMTYQIEEVKKANSECNTDKKLVGTVNALMEKITAIEKMVKPGSSRDRKNSIHSIDATVGDKIDSSLSKNKLIKTIIKNSEKTSHNVEELNRLMQENTANSCKHLEQESKICNILEAHEKATLERLSSLKHSISDQATNAVLEHEISSIKQYLKLLLPRIIGLESNSKKLYHDYHELRNDVTVHLQLNAMQVENILLHDNSLVVSTVPGMPKRNLNETTVSDSINVNQKKRRLI